jgi:hypothetical protein
LKGPLSDGNTSRSLAARDVRSGSCINGSVPSFHEGLRKNLVPVPHDLLNRYSFIPAVYLPIRGSDPARMVLTEPIAAS